MYKIPRQGVCSHCKNSFKKNTPNQLYCSKKCSKKVYEQKYTKDRTLNHLSRSQIGAISELDVCSHYLRKGYQVFRNVCASGPADIIIWNPETNEIHMIDVKTHVSTNDPQKVTECNSNKSVKVIPYNYTTRKCDERTLEDATTPPKY